MKKCILIPMIALGAIIVSCQKEAVDQQKEFTISATFESQLDNGARTTLCSDGQVFWSANDEIVVLNGEEGYNVKGYKFYITQGQGTKNAQFSSVSFPQDGTPSYAVFPSGNRFRNTENGKFTFTLSGTQVYVKDSFDPKANVMLAKYEGGLKFKNVCGILRLQLTGDCTINRMQLVSLDSDEALWGDATVTMSESGVINSVSVANTASNKNIIVLDCGEDGVKLDPVTATLFNIVVPTGSLGSGFAVYLEENGTPYLKTLVTSSDAIKRSVITRMAKANIAPSDPESDGLQIVYGESAELPLNGIVDTGLKATNNTKFNITFSTGVAVYGKYSRICGARRSGGMQELTLATPQDGTSHYYVKYQDGSPTVNTKDAEPYALSVVKANNKYSAIVEIKSDVQGYYPTMTFKDEVSGTDMKCNDENVPRISGDFSSQMNFCLGGFSNVKYSSLFWSDTKVTIYDFEYWENKTDNEIGHIHLCPAIMKIAGITLKSGFIDVISGKYYGLVDPSLSINVKATE